MPGLIDDVFDMKCPGCESNMRFTVCEDSIEVNCESWGTVTAPKMLNLLHGCNNPMCKWSKVKGDWD